MGRPEPSDALRAAARATWVRAVDAKRWARRSTDDVAGAAALVAEALATGHKLLVCGNGGSAADAQHIAAELTGRYVKERDPLPAVALTTDTSALTAIANDYGYEHVFSRQVRALGTAGDVLLAISTSGNSPSVIAAIDAAKELGMATIAMTGGRPSRCAELADVVLRAGATETARVQETHIFFGHLLCELLELDPTPAGDRSPAFERCDDDLLALRRQWADSGLRVVLTNGVFDLLHAGHLSSLEMAKALGDVLVVGVNVDETTRRLKGAGRPVYGELDRLRLVAALEPVDVAVLFEEDDAATLVERLQPDIWCKGGDYPEADLPGLPETKALEVYGGAAVIVPLLAGRSTSSTIARLQGSGPDAG